MKIMECDVAVVAMGLSGLANAIAAAEQGLTVIGFEKMRVVGGAANMGMGPFAVESRVQKQRQLTLTREQAFRMHMNYCHWNVDARLVHDYFWKTADTIDWLLDMGVEFEVQPYFPTAQWTAHNVIPEGGGRPGPRGASTMVKRLSERAEAMGVQIMYECPVKSIIMEDGKAVGIRAVSADGEEIECRAKAVTIATGGAGENKELIEKLCGSLENYVEDFAAVPGLTGDGIRMAWEAGAAHAKVQISVMGVGVSDNFNHWILEASFRGKPELMVNINGERFYDESMNEMGTFVANALCRQPGKVAWEIMDSDRLKYLKKNGPETLDEVHGDDFYEHFDEAAQAAIDEGYEDFFIAETYEEICEKTGIDYRNFMKTIETYNHACDIGRDDELSKPARYLNPVRKPPFYVQKMIPQGADVSGGIETTRKLEVLDTNKKIIPGLYATGIDAANIYGECYDFYLPGNNMGFALNSGRMAAEAEAEYINGIF